MPAVCLHYLQTPIQLQFPQPSSSNKRLVFPVIILQKDPFPEEFILLSCPTLRMSACQPKQALLVDDTLTVGVDPMDYTAAVLLLAAEVIYWTGSKTCGNYQSFTHKKPTGGALNGNPHSLSIWGIHM